MTLSRLVSRAIIASRVGTRTAFTSAKADHTKPNWLRVGLTLGATGFIWALFLKQHSEDVHEYRVRNGLE